MHSNKRRVHLGAACAFLFGLLAGATFAVAASQETVLHEFCSISGCADGSQPYGLIFDAAGNLYGTTVSGGANRLGTVFQLTPNGDGTWTENVLYSFRGDDGENPVAGVILDSAGNLYGTTEGGGVRGEGTVFELSPNGDGTWTQKVLHSFYHNKYDGRAPVAGLAMDAAGNLYGTTPFGGHQNRVCPGPGHVCGTVFELTPGANGTWKETILYNFCTKGACKDGFHPVGGVVLGNAGELYGTTSIGGDFGIHDCHPKGCGLVFQLSPGAKGKWKERVLHNFTAGKDSKDPGSTLTLDAVGNLYGTTRLTVFELQKNSGWKETVLHSFKKGHLGIDHPLASLVFDASGNLYGTSENGGTGNCRDGCGIVFRLVPQGNGKWSLDTIYRFNSAGNDGTEPNAGVIFDPAGSLYGTTVSGGVGPCLINGMPGCGTVFEITP